MHLFLYQSARHANNWGNRHRYKQGTIRGDFDLELLKRGIKGRFKILPHGAHPFQVVLQQINLEEEFYGHIVQIEDKRNAVWFKLNYDQVGKNVTKYLGGWGDLNPADIDSTIREYQMYKTQFGKLNGQMSTLRHQNSSVTGFINPRNALDPLCDKAVAYGRIYLDVIAKTLIDIEREAALTKSKMDACQQVVRDYLKARKL